MKLRFTLKKLFRSYPITIVSILLLLICITIILIQSHVYAMSEKDNTPGCNCEDEYDCPQSLPLGFETCELLQYDCDCMYSGGMAIKCNKPIKSQKCTGYKGCLGVPCVETDCSDCTKCAPPDCEICVVLPSHYYCSGLKCNKCPASCSSTKIN